LFHEVYEGAAATGRPFTAQHTNPSVSDCESKIIAPGIGDFEKALKDKKMSKFKSASAFKVRKLKDGSGYQVVMDPQERVPELLIGDFLNEGEANEWIKTR
jgi:hypothetical protein